MNLNNRPRRLRTLIRIMIPIAISYFAIGLWVEHLANQVLTDPKFLNWKFQKDGEIYGNQKPLGCFPESRPLDYLIFSRRLVVDDFHSHDIPWVVDRTRYDVYVSPIGLFEDRQGGVPIARSFLACLTFMYFVFVASCVVLWEKKKRHSDEELANETTCNQDTEIC